MGCFKTEIVKRQFIGEEIGTKAAEDDKLRSLQNKATGHAPTRDQGSQQTKYRGEFGEQIITSQTALGAYGGSQ